MRQARRCATAPGVTDFQCETGHPVPHPMSNRRSSLLLPLVFLDSLLQAMVQDGCVAGRASGSRDGAVDAGFWDRLAGVVSDSDGRAVLGVAI